MQQNEMARQNSLNDKIQLQQDLLRKAQLVREQDEQMKRMRVQQ
jgi:hypothetical protein